MIAIYEIVFSSYTLFVTKIFLLMQRINACSL